MPGLVAGDDLLVGASFLAHIVRPENFFGTQSARGNALGKNVVHALRFSTSDDVAHSELTIFEQGDKASSKAEKIGGADDKGLKKMFEVAAGTEFGGNFQQLVKFASLALRRGTHFGMSHGHRAESGNC